MRFLHLKYYLILRPRSCSTWSHDVSVWNSKQMKLSSSTYYKWHIGIEHCNLSNSTANNPLAFVSKWYILILITFIIIINPLGRVGLATPSLTLTEFVTVHIQTLLLLYLLLGYHPDVIVIHFATCHSHLPLVTRHRRYLCANLSLSRNVNMFSRMTIIL